MSSFSASVTQDRILDKPLHHTCRDISCFLRLLGPGDSNLSANTAVPNLCWFGWMTSNFVMV